MKDINMEKALLEAMARMKARIQIIQLWIDNARTNHIAKIRYEKTKNKVRSLIKTHKGLFQNLKKLKRWD